jgi:hypothetical protein
MTAVRLLKQATPCHGDRSRAASCSVKKTTVIALETTTHGSMRVHACCPDNSAQRRWYTRAAIQCPSSYAIPARSYAGSVLSGFELEFVANVSTHQRLSASQTGDVSGLLKPWKLTWDGLQTKLRTVAPVISALTTRKRWPFGRKGQRT